jgi:hypothetical protein
VLAEQRSFRRPAPYADVHVIVLGKDPAVAARNDPELEHEPVPEALVNVFVSEVSFERHGMSETAAQTQSARRRPVHAVGDDERSGAQPDVADSHADAVLVEADVRHTGSIQELRACLDGTSHQMSIETPPLRHQTERRVAAALEALAVAKPDLEPVDLRFDDGVDRKRELAQRAHRDAASAWLVARKTGTVYKEDRRLATRKSKGSR